MYSFWRDLLALLGGQSPSPEPEPEPDDTGGDA
jgi:hypothetical protein